VGEVPGEVVAVGVPPATWAGVNRSHACYHKDNDLVSQSRTYAWFIKPASKLKLF
jgi:hypothetical protein